jgi:predicted ATPase/DNA-binding winged helix-turn-helix (wHTH) protein
MDASAISFGPFRLVAAQRLLLEDDKPVRLGSRAFDILAALVERAGQVVGKEELIARAWPQTFVEEANLKIQVSALRRALGDGQSGHRYVVTVPGRGYNFVAPVSLDGPSRAPLPPTTTPAGVHNLPLAVTRMVGREEAVAALVSRLSRERLVTIVGPGGIGKTTVALTVAERMIASYEHGIWLVDLAPLGDPRLVPSAVATALGLEIRMENPLPGLIAGLGDRRLLLLLDNCEHVIDAAAGLAAAVLGGAPGVNILATSREPLGVSGERKYRLGPLSSPPSSSRTAADAATFPAVQLFVERVTAIVEDFALTDANAPLVVEICRRLDGLPLAIEFAAPRVEVLGVKGLAARLDDSLLLLQGRRRTAMPRHRTMRAVIDWSYGLLSEDEQRFFRALGIFSGGFTVEAAAAVAMDVARTQVVAIDRLADLVAKSLVVADVGGAKPRFRLLDTTRGYAIEKLDESGERDRIARRHAAYYRDLFERAEGEVTARSTREWLADYAREIDNLRAALDWAFSPGGDRSIGVALTAAAVPLWTHLSLIEECRDRVERAVAALGGEAGRDARCEMRLRAELGTCLIYASGGGGGVGPEIGPALTRALEIAESLDDAEYQLRSIWGLWALHIETCQLRVALEIAQRFRTLAAKQREGNDQLIGDRMIGVTLHLLGDQARARRNIEHMLAHYVPPVEKPHRWIDHRVSARVCLARVLWLQGFPDEAMRTARSAVEEARETNHALSLTYALAHGACPIMLWVEDLAAAERYITTLLDHSTRHALPLWCAMGRAFQGILVIRRGELGPGLRLLRAGFDEFGGVGFISVMFLSELAASFGRAGQAADGLATAEQAIEQAEQTEGRWVLPESLRIKGELLLLQAADGAAAAADDHFRQAVDWARRQGELSWELRAATSLARLLRNQGRLADAIGCLQPIYDRFTEGFDTADLIVAKRLLDELGSAERE